MKTVISMIGMFLLISFANAQNDNLTAKAENENTEKIKIEWTKSNHDFKDIAVGIPVTASFKFTNKDIDPVTITKVKSSCGCTVANYSKAPVLPGKSGQVSATYNAAKHGAFHKSITVYLSDNSSYRLTLKGNVKKMK